MKKAALVLALALSAAVLLAQAPAPDDTLSVTLEKDGKTQGFRFRRASR